jgi:trimeric autotransporter adhesin
MKKFYLSICFILIITSTFSQTTVFSDDFSANTNAVFTTSGAIGASAWNVLVPNADWGARRNTSPLQLELTNDASATGNANGWVFASTNTSSFLSPYNTTLSSNTGTVTWNLNIRQIRPDPAGLGAGSYGVAFVLAGSSTTNNNTGNGYAIAYGQSGATDPVRLIHYTAGLATSTNIITSNTAGLTDFGTEYLSVRVIYTPSTNTWELLLRNDGATAFADPASGTLVTQGTAVNSTSTGSVLGLMGAFWNGSTAANQTSFFDNVSVTVTTVGGSTISIAAGTNAAEAPAPTAGTFAITFSTPTTASTTVDYAYTGSATFGTDYTVSYSAGTPSTATSTGTLTVPSGVSAITVTITPIDDATVEGTETVIATLSNPTAGYSLLTSTATINITDDDTPNTVSVAAGVNAGEPSTNGTFTLSLSAPAPVGGVTITYSFTGTATLTSDYTDALSGSITIAQGQSAGTITATVVNDILQETDETITITLNTASASYIINTASAGISITDNGDIDAIPYTGTTYTQNFNTLATSGLATYVVSGWGLFETGTNANFSYSASDGTPNSGNTYSFGTGTNADRAFGGLRSGSLIPLVGGKFINNTGSTVNSLTVTYTGEQWRSGTASRVDKLDFQYSTDATSLSTGTWTDVDALDFTSPNNAAVGALDGNLSANRVTKTFALNGISIPAGSVFFFRWQDFDASGADDGLGIDDFSLSPGCTPPTNQPTALLLTPALTAINGSFTAAVAGTDPADAYLVVMSTSASLGGSPASGTAYAIDDVIGNGQVVSIGSSLTFNVTGLTPSTTYYFFVFSNISATNCYNITSPLTGSIATLSPPPCTAPTPQASGLTAANITGTSLDLNYTRGGGTDILIVARVGSPVNSNPINSLAYPVSTQIGTDNFVIYNGTANTFSYTGLLPNTNYYFALYEYNSADLCYNTTALTGNFNTACVNPVNVTALSTTAGNATVSVTWTLPNASCYDEIIVVASNASVPGVGSDYTAPANATYAGPNQVVYRGTGTNVTVTGLTNGTTYFFRVFTRLGSNYSSGVQTTGTPFDPSSGYLYLFGNLHSHSSYSDGNKDDLSKIPADDYAFARDALCMDFLGISEHNHAGAGMALSDYALGYSQANAINGVVGGVSGNSIVTLWGMEWGVISGGGHVLTYGFEDQLVGWEAGNYNIFVAKNDYASLFNLINGQPGAFASLAHPNSSDYGNIAGTAYDAAKDNAIAATAVESGPAFSTNSTFPYNDFPSQLAYLGYYKTMLAKGYRLGASVDQDNHNLTFGTANANRLVVLTAAKTRSEVMNAIRSMRFYASNDCNARVDYKLNANVMGSSVTAGGVPSITLSVTDLDAEDAATIEIWGGQVGAAVPSGPIKTYAGVNSIAFNSGNPENTQADLSTYYYFAIITQTDGNKIVTSPIWYSRSDITLPVTLISFDASYNPIDNSVLLRWSTAQEFDTKTFAIQRSNDFGANYTTIGTIAAGGTTTSIRNYRFTDFHPSKGKNLYRLQQINIDNSYDYSRIASITISDNKETDYFTVYPNPVANGFTYIYPTMASSLARATIQLIDMSGKTVKVSDVTFNGPTPIKYDLMNIRPGIYFVKIVSEDMVSTEKIIIR